MSDIPTLPTGNTEQKNIKPQDQVVTNKLNHFFQKVSQIFKNKQLPNTNLLGRINQLKSDGQSTLNDLIKVQTNLNTKCDVNTCSLINGLLEPLIKELSRVKGELGIELEATQQVKTVHRCVEITTKAKPWLDLSSEDYDINKINAVIISSCVQEFHAKISRDINIIKDYVHNSLNSINIAQYTKEVLLASLEPDIEIDISNLENLKQLEAPAYEMLNFWRAEIDEHREEHFSAALHKIDEFISEFIPMEPIEEVSDHVLALLHKLSELENETKILSNSIEKFHEKDDKFQNQFLSRLDKLEELAHHLNINLLLPTDDSERVQRSIENLKSIRNKINVF